MNRPLFTEFGTPQSSSPSVGDSPTTPLPVLPQGEPNEIEVCYSPELAEALQRIETEVQQEIDLQRQQELARQRELARYD